MRAVIISMIPANTLPPSDYPSAIISTIASTT